MDELTTRKKVTIMISIMSTLLFVALNQTIVGTALPKIVADIGGMQYFNWVFTIFMLASSITAILVGKLSDIYGRKPFILIGLGVFTLGAFLNGTSGTIFHLITYRGIQGLGGGMIMSTAFTAVGDLFPPRERGRWQGLMGASFGLASVFGPTLGGYIVDHFHWHWVFWVFLPFGLVAFGLIWWLFPPQAKREGETVDYIGALVLVLTLVPLLLAVSWAGSAYAWLSPVILGLLAASAGAFILFIFIERRAKSPILPLHLFANRIFTISNIVGFMLGVGMFGTIMYMPFFIQGVMGATATASGFMMMAMTLSNVSGSAISGQIVTKTGKYKKLALGGLAIMASGLVAATFLSAGVHPSFVVACLIVIGFGLGTCFPIFTLTVQNAIPHSYLGVATSSAQLFRQLGGAVGVSAMGSIMNALVARQMTNHATTAAELPQLQRQLDELQNPQLLMDHDKLAQLQAGLPSGAQPVVAELIDQLRGALGTALSGVFFTGACVIAVAFVLTLFLKEIKLRTTNR
ncbi:MDR family MFS transporter [Numidum massiliense]|uniref:MDR family MFS transporter n=1 Tax=Numidum massiliense TaxID=1522315 RepID=UPI0006D5865C|nr:MDR family MFS transporter [Numidum massiliense]